MDQEAAGEKVFPGHLKALLPVWERVDEAMPISHYRATETHLFPARTVHVEVTWTASGQPSISTYTTTGDDETYGTPYTEVQRQTYLSVDDVIVEMDYDFFDIPPMTGGSVSLYDRFIVFPHAEDLPVGSP